MPTPLATSLLAAGAVLTSASETAGCIVAGIGLGIEVVRFYFNGVDGG